MRIQQLFQREKAFIGYLTAGDGGMERTYDAAIALINGGVNLLEIGIPFSDPVADGPVIQRAAARSLMSGTTLNDVLVLIKNIRQQSNVPIILFSYLNPILAALSSGFLSEAKRAGADGLLLVDCPLEESADIQRECDRLALNLIYVIASTTPLSRVELIAQSARGFLYYACRKGTTGMKNTLPDDFQEKVAAIKARVSLPVVVGFGISNREMAQQVLQHADGVVVGSLFVKALEDGMDTASLKNLAQEFV